MTRRRAILTDRERELLRDDDAGDQRYVAVSRVRTKIQEELVEDISILQESHPALYEELRDVVCDGTQEAAVTPEESMERTDPTPPPEPQSDATGGDVDDEGGRVPDPSVGEGVREELREELAGSGDLLEARVDELLKMYDVLRERGEAEREELLDAVDVEATKYQDRESVWSNMVKGKDTLRALPGVEKPPTGRTVWTYEEP